MREAVFEPNKGDDGYQDEYRSKFWQEVFTGKQAEWILTLMGLALLSAIVWAIH